MSERFKKLFYAPRGHTYWQDTKAGMIAVSDDSGSNPENTDDGLLWLDTTKPIIASGSSFSVPLLVPKSSRAYRRAEDAHSSTGATPAEVRLLIEHFGMKVSVDGLELSKPCGYSHDERHSESEYEQGYC